MYTPPPLNVLPCIANLTSDQVEWKEPWKHAECPRVNFPDKDAYKAYISDEKTQSCLISGISGINRHQRVSRNNPPARLHAIVADFDSRIDDVKRKKYLDRISIKPSYISRSYSGGTHAIWLLEEPLPLLPDPLSQQNLLKHIAKELKLKSAFGTLDENAYYNTSQVFHVGWEWQEGGGSPIPATRTALWLDAALKKANLGDDALAIPIDRVAREVEKRFPNRWTNDFLIGARGCRFWDASADSPTAAIVTEKGMVCFTGVHPFRSWRDIFGEEFIEQYKQDTLGTAVHDCYFINNKFYVKVPMLSPDGSSSPTWQCYNRQNFESFLASSYGLRARCNKDSGEQESQVKQAIGRIVSQKSLSGAVPFIYNKDEVVKMGDKFFLNTSFIRVMKPDEAASTEWAESFPWIAQFLKELFPDIIQRERFICEWAYAYQNAYHFNPKSGRTIFIAGEPGVGKNFLTEVLIGPSLGGYEDASDYLLGISRFNIQLYETGAWILNDSVSKDDWKERAHFTKMLKKMAANKRHAVEGKFKDAAAIQWSGRIYVTLNTDPISLGLLPEIDINNRDKISLYRTSDTVMHDPNAARNAKKELPSFCNYLLHLEFPEHCQGDSRWGVNGYLHPELYEAAENSGQSAAFEEVLTMYLNSVFAADKSITEIAGTSAEIFSRLSIDEATKELLRGKNSTRWVSISLGLLKKRGDFPLAYKKTNTVRVWVVKRSAWENYLNSAKSSVIDDVMPF